MFDRPVPLSAEAFAPFGSVVAGPPGEPTAADATFSYWSDLLHFGVEGEVEVGLCTVYARASQDITWMERHRRTPELLVPADAPFLLPVMDAAGHVSVFEVGVGQAVLIGAGVWHSACAPLPGTPSCTYFVQFRRGTPQEDVEKTTIAGARP
jgi:ureidoglycolate hydrolase